MGFIRKAIGKQERTVVGAFNKRQRREDSESEEGEAGDEVMLVESAQKE